MSLIHTQGASLVSQRRVQTREMRSLLFPPDLPYCPDLNVNVKNVKEVEKEVNIARGTTDPGY